MFHKYNEDVFSSIVLRRGEVNSTLYSCKINRLLELPHCEQPGRRFSSSANSTQRTKPESWVAYPKMLDLAWNIRNVRTMSQKPHASIVQY